MAMQGMGNFHSRFLSPLRLLMAASLGAMTAIIKGSVDPLAAVLPP
jgi:hypothetical protein